MDTYIYIYIYPVVAGQRRAADPRRDDAEGRRGCLIHIYIYICIERESDIYIYIYTHNYTSIVT